MVARILRQSSRQFRAPADTWRRKDPGATLFPLMCVAAPTRTRRRSKLPHQTARHSSTFATFSKREIMKTSFSKNQLGLAVACALALSFVSGATLDPNALPSTPEPVAVAPKPVAKGGAPAPVVVAAAPPQAVYEQVSLDANVLFDFDKSVLRPEGKDALDSFVSKIQGIGGGSISAVGYADRFGTNDYNQALSERRVATVKAYLVSKGVEPSWGLVKTDAKGETAPTTAPGQCTGATPNSSTIACLQPDRHVSVVISGQRLKK